MQTVPRSDAAGTVPATPIAIVCGGGSFPLQVAEAASARGRPVFLLGLHGIADPAIARFPHAWIKLGEGRRPRKLLAAHGCRELCIIGNLTRPSLGSLSFDWDSLRFAGRVARLFVGGDNRLLSGIARILEDEYGLKVVGAQEVAPEILAPEGAFGRHAPAPRDLADIRIGVAVLRALGPFDIGQAVVVADQYVLGVEAAEGTDGLLERIAELRRIGRVRAARGVGVLIKVPNPGQDHRLDLPAIGPRTVEAAARAGLAGIAVAAHATVVAAPADLVAAADAARLFVMGVAEDGPLGADALGADALGADAPSADA